MSTRTEKIEGQLKFIFATKNVEKYDDWSFYRNQFTNMFDGAKAVDFIYLDEQILWLIEVKDFRLKPREKDISLWREISLKVRDTLVGLVCAKNNANDYSEKSFAEKCLKKKRINIVFHIEQQKKSRLYPEPFNLATLSMKLKQELKSVGKIIVTAKNTNMNKVSWDVIDI